MQPRQCWRPRPAAGSCGWLGGHACWHPPPHLLLLLGAVGACLPACLPTSRQPNLCGQGALLPPSWLPCRALSRFFNDRDWWNGLAKRVMQMDWSWNSPA